MPNFSDSGRCPRATSRTLSLWALWESVRPIPTASSTSAAAVFHQLHERVQRPVHGRRDPEFFTALDNVTIERINLGGVAARAILSHRGSRIGHGIAELGRRLHKLLDTGKRNSRRPSHEDNLPDQLFDDATGERIILNRAIARLGHRRDGVVSTIHDQLRPEFGGNVVGNPARDMGRIKQSSDTTYVFAPRNHGWKL